MIAVSAFILEAWLQPRGYSPEFIRTVLLQTPGHRPMVLYAELPRVGWFLVDEKSAG